MFDLFKGVNYLIMYILGFFQVEIYCKFLHTIYICVVSEYIDKSIVTSSSVVKPEVLDVQDRIYKYVVR